MLQQRTLLHPFYGWVEILLCFRDVSDSKESANLPAIWETWLQSLHWEDPLEKGVATHSSILAWEIPWTEEPEELPSKGSQGVGGDWVTNTFTFRIPLYMHTASLSIHLLMDI